jgi:hypothetical protein
MRFIGTGTGRCGTMSLANILGVTPRSDVTHERFHPLWYGGPAQPAFEEAVRWFKKYDERENHLIGDVSSFWLPHIANLKAEIPDLRVVCLHRDKDQVVESFLKWLAGLSNLRPVDMFVLVQDPILKLYINLFPTIDHLTAKQAWEVYWDLCEKIMAEIEPPVLHMDMEDLNDNEALDQVHAFLGVNPEDRIKPLRRRYNEQPMPGQSR